MMIEMPGRFARGTEVRIKEIGRGRDGPKQEDREEEEGE